MERGDGLHVRIDEVVANGIKRQHPVAQIVGDLLEAEIAEKQARSIRYGSPSLSCPWLRN
jgi:hypothetical protein